MRMSALIVVLGLLATRTPAALIFVSNERAAIGEAVARAEEVDADLRG
jgi:hypothetical protein